MPFITDVCYKLLNKGQAFFNGKFQPPQLQNSIC